MFSVIPEIPETVRGQLGVAHGVLDVFVPEVCLKGACIVAGIRECKTARVPEHVWMHF